MATIITVPHLIRDGGISPKRLRTFSERNSISSDDFFFLEFIISIALLDSKNKFHKTIMFLIQVDSLPNYSMYLSLQ